MNISIQFHSVFTAGVGKQEHIKMDADGKLTHWLGFNQHLSLTLIYK